ncbi:hypothetical protein [Halohasta litorea]|uniref:Uncharacterized protein n=1 Tax=Halohasta litorea TaxID=869891 RepID=A0ABD6D6C1_9EURY|nr:hypothetical protein [Halohasta litorea]MEA1932410.1 hypothetical protein [Euryarchaeota archaeon]
MSEVPTYHLVCRDCPTELVVETAARAEQRATDHESITGHRLDFKRID